MAMTKEARMIRKAFLGAALAGVIGLAGCQSGPTPYQPGGGAQRGYAETKIEGDRYRISFKGNSLTDKDTVENYMLYRAAELTLQNGFDNFTIANRDTDKDSRYRSSGPYFGTHLSYMYYSPRFGWYGAYDPFWTTERFDEITRYEAYAEILMGRGPKGSDPNAFDAHEVSKNLGPLISRPPQ
jgi:hypothetical protein